jgi:hypothetical protein
LTHRISRQRALGALLLGVAASAVRVQAVELRLTPVATESLGYSNNVFIIEDRVEPGREEGDFFDASKADAS